MFAAIPEEHDCSKRKPRLPQSQGVGTGPSTNPLRLAVSTSNLTFTPVSMLDYRRVAKTLALAFDKDPFVNYILNTAAEYPPESRLAKKKADLMLSLFEHAAYEYMALGGLVVAIKDNNLELELVQQRVRALAAAKVPFLGVACWNKLTYDEESGVYASPIGRSSLQNMHPTSLKFNLFSSLAKCRLKVSRIGDVRLRTERDTVLTDMMTVGDLKKEQDVWYLGDVGIIPAAQGAGLARRLIDHCLDNYMAGHWCYLELSNLANRRFYEKLGWNLKHTYVINDEVSESDSDDSVHSGVLRRRRKPVPAEDLIYIDSFVVYTTGSKAVA